jgi:hypothetical protein
MVLIRLEYISGRQRGGSVKKKRLSRKAKLEALKKESKRAEIDQIRRCLALRPELRTNFLRKRIAYGMSAL